MTLKKYIQEKKQNNFIVKGIKVFLKDPSIHNVDYEKAISIATSKVPLKLLSNLQSIHIGEFEELQTRKIQALYEKSKIFLTNSHETIYDILDDVVHEIAHSIEEIYPQKIYSDKLLEKEFLQKRKKLWKRLKDKGFERQLSDYMNLEYNKEFDMYLYMEIGYPMLRAITKDIFYSPYAATSLREYFANSFEAFFMREDIPRLKSISPVAFQKNVILLDTGE